MRVAAPADHHGGRRASARAASASGPCVDAAAQRARVKGLLAEGRLNRVLRVIARADKLCPTTAAESAAERAAAQAELDREPGTDGEVLYRAGVEAKRAGDAAAAQRLFDRAIVAIERAAHALPGFERARLGIDAPNGVIGDIHGIAWCAVGKAGCLAVAHDKAISVYDAGTWRERYTIDAGETVYALALSPEGRTLATAAIRALQLWDLERGQSILRVKGAGDDVVWSQDGRFLVMARSHDRTIEVWSAPDRKPIRTIVAAAPPGGKEPATIDGIAVSARGETIAAGFTDGSLKLWRGANGAEIRTIAADPARLRAVALSPDGKLVAAAGTTGVRVWSTATGKEVRHVSKKFSAHLAFRRRRRRAGRVDAPKRWSRGMSRKAGSSSAREERPRRPLRVRARRAADRRRGHARLHPLGHGERHRRAAARRRTRRRCIRWPGRPEVRCS